MRPLHFVFRALLTASLSNTVADLGPSTGSWLFTTRSPSELSATPSAAYTRTLEAPRPPTGGFTNHDGVGSTVTGKVLP